MTTKTQPRGGAERDTVAAAARVQRFLLPGIIVIGIIMRWMFLSASNDHPLFSIPLSDGKIYWDWASSIADSNNWLGSEVFFMAPVYPYFLALIFVVLGKSMMTVKIIQLILSAATIYIIYRTGKKLFDEWTGIIAALLTSFCGQLIFYCSLALSETLQIFFIALLLFELSSLLRDKQYRRFAYLGLLGGINILFRPNFIIVIFAIGIFVFLIRKHLPSLSNISSRKILYLIIGFVCFPLLVTIRNYAAAGDIVALTSNGGINLWIGNNHGAIGVFQSPKEFDFYSDMSGKQYASAQMKHKLKDSEADVYWRNKTFEEISANPLRTFGLFLKKIGLFFSDAENPQSSIMNIAVAREQVSTVLSLSFISFPILLLITILGISFYKNERTSVLLLATSILSFAFATALFFINGRFRLGAYPALILLSAFSIRQIYPSLREMKFKPLLWGIITVTIYLIINFTLIPHFQFRDYDAYLHIAKAEFESGRYDEALNNYSTANSIQETAIGSMGIANVLSIQGKFSEAESQFRKAIQLQPNDHLIYFNLGLCLAQQKKFKEAIPFFEQALRFKPDFYESHRNLGIIYQILEKYDQAIKEYELYLPQCSDEAVRTSIKADLEKIKGK